MAEQLSGGRAVAALIDAARALDGLSDRQVAAGANVHVNTLGNWRKGRAVSLDALSRVATYMGLPLTSLCEAYQGQTGAVHSLPGSEAVSAVLERLTGHVVAVEASLDLLGEALGVAPSPNATGRRSSSGSRRP